MQLLLRDHPNFECASSFSTLLFAAAELLFLSVAVSILLARCAIMQQSPCFSHLFCDRSQIYCTFCLCFALCRKMETSRRSTSPTWSRKAQRRLTPLSLSCSKFWDRGPLARYQTLLSISHFTTLINIRYFSSVSRKGATRSTVQQENATNLLKEQFEKCLFYII